VDGREREADGDRRKAGGARFDVAPMMTIRKKAVSTVSIRNTDSRPERSIDSES
jgi:hypothetical protein